MDCVNDLNRAPYAIDIDIVSVHNAYEKELHRIGREHQKDLDDLETCYRKEISLIIKEKDSVLFQLYSVLQSLIKYIELRHSKLKPQRTGFSAKNVEPFKERYQYIKNAYKNERKYLSNQILELREFIAEKKKINQNKTSVISLLKEENSALKQFYDVKEMKSSNSELIIVFILWCLAAVLHQLKDNTLKYFKIKHILELILILIMLFWYFVKFKRLGSLVLLNIVFGAVFYFIIL